MRSYLRRGFVPLNEMFYRIQRERLNRLNTIFDKLTFLHILGIWMGVVVLFGIFYYYGGTERSYLFSNIHKEAVTSLLDHIYFSFITATSTGFGDIVPFGYFKVISILEVVWGLVLLAFVTSKLISIKQDVILGEIYDISFQERIHGLRSSLLLFRQNCGRLINQLEEGTLKKREVNELYTYISSFEDVLNEIADLLNDSDEDAHFTKVLDPVNTELIFNGVIHSFEKLQELVEALNKSKVEWQRDITVNLIHKCLMVNKSLFAKLAAPRMPRAMKTKAQPLPDKKVQDLTAANTRVVEGIKKGLEPGRWEGTVSGG